MRDRNPVSEGHKVLDEIMVAIVEVWFYVIVRVYY